MKAEQRFKCLQQAIKIETQKDEPDEDEALKIADKFDEYVEEGELPDDEEHTES